MSEINNIPADGSRHKVRCVDFGLCWTENNTEQLALALEIVEGEHKGFITQLYLSFSAAAREYSIDKMRALGWTGDDFAKLDSIKSKIAIASFQHEEYEDKIYARVGWVNPLGVQMKKPMTANEIAAFATGMKRAIGAPRTNSVPPRDDVPPPTDADAPPQR